MRPVSSRKPRTAGGPEDTTSADLLVPSTVGASPTIEPTGRRRPRRSLSERLRGWGTIAVFLTPALALFAVLVLLPIVYAAYGSLFRWNGFGTPSDYVGLHNFRLLFQDDAFIADLEHGGLLIGLSLVVQLPLALGLAILLNQNLRGRAVYRVMFFAPYVLSEVITAVLFRLVFAPDQGVAAHLTNLIGLGNAGGNWLSSTTAVIYVLFFVVTWKYFGFHMIIYMAGLQGIPKELHEAAAIDGAGAWQAFRRVTLPLLGPTIRISVFLSVIGAIQLFDMVFVFTGGGPVHASETMAVTMFQFGFRRDQVGYASAISMFMFLASFIFAIFYQRFALRRDTQGAMTVLRDQR